MIRCIKKQFLDRIKNIFKNFQKHLERIEKSYTFANAFPKYNNILF